MTTPADTIRRVFENVLDDGTPWRHPNAPIHVRAVKGRCVHAGLSGTPRWAELAELLTGPGMPCEEFRLEGRELYVRVKTDAQRAADDAALEFDEANGELFTCPDFANLVSAADEQLVRSRKEKRGKWEKLLEDFIRASGETAFTRLSLLQDACEAFNKAGQTIRLDNLNRELKKLIGRVLEATPDGEEFTVISEEN